MCFQARQQIAQLQADREGEEQHAAAAEQAQKQLQDKVHMLEQVKAASVVPRLCLTCASPVHRLKVMHNKGIGQDDCGRQAANGKRLA